MTDILRVYIAGPYTAGDVAMNVRQAVLAGLEIHKAGHVPFIPHLYHFAHYLCPQDYAVWCALDLQWLKACHCVLRLAGASPGADREVEFATVLGLQIYHSLPACLQALPPSPSQGVPS
jgi:hypothetical protein